MIDLLSSQIVILQTTLREKTKENGCEELFTFLIPRQARMSPKRLAGVLLATLLQNIRIAKQAFKRLSTSLAAERILDKANKLRGNHRLATSTRSHQILLDLKRARRKK